VLLGSKKAGNKYGMKPRARIRAFANIGSEPTLVTNDFDEILQAYLLRNDLKLSDIDLFACHPGGAKVLDALEDTFGLARSDLALSASILRDFGNMSSPTVLFVLERAIRAGLPERAAVIAMGPGFSASCVTLKRIG